VDVEARQRTLVALISEPEHAVADLHAGDTRTERVDDAHDLEAEPARSGGDQSGRRPSIATGTR
jgi:hypothetical protein